MPAPLDQSRREKRIAVIRTCYTLEEAARSLNISKLGLAKWLRGEGISPRELLLKAPPRGPAEIIPETCSKHGAEALARRIESYWRNKGYKVSCRVEHIGNPNNTPYYSVSSDMINGLPARLARGGL